VKGQLANIKQVQHSFGIYLGKVSVQPGFIVLSELCVIQHKESTIDESLNVNSISACSDPMVILYGDMLITEVPPEVLIKYREARANVPRLKGNA